MIDLKRINRLRFVKLMVLGLFFVCLFSSNFAIAEDNTGGLPTPSYYKEKHMDNGQLKPRNDERYVKEDAKFIMDLVASGGTSKDISELFEKYPHMAKSGVNTFVPPVQGGGAGAILFFDTPVKDEIIRLLNKNKKLSPEERQAIYKEIFPVFDESGMAGMKTEGDIKFRADLIFRDYEQGLITEEDYLQRVKEIGYKGDLYQRIDTQGYHQSKNRELTAAEKNKNCQVQSFTEKYTSSCYSCMIVKLLVETFMKNGVTFYDVSKSFAVTILMMGSAIWLAIYVIKSISSFAQAEPGNMLGDISTFLFKAFVAYALIHSGISFLISNTLDPIIATGADYGLEIINGTNGGKIQALQNPIIYEGPNIIGKKAIQKMFDLNVRLDQLVSTNLILGNVINCHATHAGGWVDTTFMSFHIFIPNIWLIICGSAIWFVGFMLTLSISYYIIDVSFKLGLMVILLPIGIALWVFDITKDKLAACLSIMLNSAAVLAFLSITSSYAFVLIDAAMGRGGIEALYKKVAEGDSDWISETYSITGSYFILIVFAYFYSVKLIGSTIEGYVNKFFADKIFSGASPMHNKLKAITEKAADVAKEGAERVWNNSKKGATALVNKSKEGEDGPSSLAGNTVKMSGQAVKTGGNLVKNTGEGIEKVGKGMGVVGKALNATKLGAIIGVPLSAAGKVTEGAGSAVKLAGKATNKVGEGVEKAGKAVNEGYKNVRDKVISGGENEKK